MTLQATPFQLVTEEPAAMPVPSFARIVVAACYVAIYAGAFAVAWQGRHGVGGGMAFTLPAMLGFPWTPLAVTALVMLNIKPQPAVLAWVLLFIVPPALNVLMILFVGRRRRTEAPGE
jgi:hypothetical protein